MNKKYIEGKKIKYFEVYKKKLSNKNYLKNDGILYEQYPNGQLAKRTNLKRFIIDGDVVFEKPYIKFYLDSLIGAIPNKYYDSDEEIDSVVERILISEDRYFLIQDLDNETLQIKFRRN